MPAPNSQNQNSTRLDSLAWSKPRAAYVHVPFCRHRCGYCNFSVVAGRDDLINRFLSALDKELAAWCRPEVDTIFIGGGTPTHLNPSQLARLLKIVDDRLVRSSDGEWSVEANPEDITRDKLQQLRSVGVNRISLGVQSFNDRKLKILERSHHGTDAAEVIELAAQLIGNVSIDLIFSAPEETLDQWLQDLRTAIRCPLSHLSTYCLTFEKGTQFWTRQQKGELSSADESLEVRMYQAARQLAASAGLQQYEVSNFALSDRRCQHNLAYWRGDSWLAAGPGAARFVEGRREVNHRSTTTWLKRIESGQDPTAETELISHDQFAREVAAFGIRLMDGIDATTFRRQTHAELFSMFAEEIDRAESEGLVLRSGERIVLTEQGILFADTVASRFLG